MNLKMPYGISNYEKIVNDGYYYVDKTMYIEKLENLPETNIMFLTQENLEKHYLQVYLKIITIKTKKIVSKNYMEIRI